MEVALFPPQVARGACGFGLRCSRSLCRMTHALSMLALVTDAYGGRGGIAQYNRDFLSALVEVGAASSIVVLPRYAPTQWPHRVASTRLRHGPAGSAIRLRRSAQQGSGTASIGSFDAAHF